MQGLYPLDVTALLLRYRGHCRRIGAGQVFKRLVQYLLKVAPGLALKPISLT